MRVLVFALLMSLFSVSLACGSAANTNSHSAEGLVAYEAWASAMQELGFDPDSEHAIEMLIATCKAHQATGYPTGSLLENEAYAKAADEFIEPLLVDLAGEDFRTSQRAGIQMIVTVSQGDETRDFCQVVNAKR